MLALLLTFGCSEQPAPTYEQVTIPAPDGTSLRATYSSPGHPGPGVMLLHMCNSDRSAWSHLAGLLAERGTHSLALDYRGYGESAGEQGETPQERQANRRLWAGDIDAALDFLRAREGVDVERIGVAGGCGVNEAVQLARRHSQIKTLALLAGSTDQEGEAFLRENSWMPLFGSASLDDGSAVELTRWLVGFSSNPENTFVEYPIGGHGTDMFATHADLEPRIADWFVEHLIARPVEKPEAVETQPGPSAALTATLREPGGPKRLRERLQNPTGSETVELPPEGVVNLYGYELLADGKIDEAIEVFLLNVDAHPDSANSYDSLADAYLAAGETVLAADNAQKVLDRLPDDPTDDSAFEALLREAARGKLDQLRGEGGTSSEP